MVLAQRSLRDTKGEEYEIKPLVAPTIIPVAERKMFIRAMVLRKYLSLRLAEIPFDLDQAKREWTECPDQSFCWATVEEEQADDSDEPITP